ncbi:MAG: TIR domain-containing protein [Anaerolineae bacterium]|nr:TIR domain-containing protein [Anaerolineae bacterium]
MARIFISYSQENEHFAGKLERELQVKGFDVLRDVTNTAAALHESSVMLLVQSSASYESQWVKEEHKLAEALKIPIIGLLIEGEPWIGSWKFNYIDLRGTKLPSIPDPVYTAIHRILQVDAIAVEQDDSNKPPQTEITRTEVSRVDRTITIAIGILGFVGLIISAFIMRPLPTNDVILPTAIAPTLIVQPILAATTPIPFIPTSTSTPSVTQTVIEVTSTSAEPSPTAHPTSTPSITSTYTFTPDLAATIFVGTNEAQIAINNAASTASSYFTQTALAITPTPSITLTPIITSTLVVAVIVDRCTAMIVDSDLPKISIVRVAPASRTMAPPIEPSTEVDVLDSEERNGVMWYQIVYDNNTGWVTHDDFSRPPLGCP